MVVSSQRLPPDLEVLVGDETFPRVEIGCAGRVRAVDLEPDTFDATLSIRAQSVANERLAETGAALARVRLRCP